MSRTSYKFDFGSGKAAAGYVPVLPTTLYTPERGYGFEPGAELRAVDRGGPDALRGSFLTADRPFFFSAAVPEGNYRVTVTLGDRGGDSVTTVKAELRRLMLEEVRTAAGKFATRTFIVNVRTPQIAGGGQVRLKSRETSSEAWAWDERLTLEFNNTRPCVCAVEIARAGDLPTVFLLGDSTVADQPAEPFNSWGQMLPRFLKPDIAVANHAESGESLESSLGAGRMDKVYSLLKPGDHLLLQYGHNDMKSSRPDALDRYKIALRQVTEETRGRGGVPVFITSMHRHTFEGNTVTNSLRDYPDAVRQVGRENRVPVIDLHAMSKVLYEALGPQGSWAAFARIGPDKYDGTHHGSYGSYELAKCVVLGIRQNKLGLAKHIVDDFPAFDPRHPDPVASFRVPVSPLLTGEKPLGS
jgi:lysophospholipase L1-like esterase